MNPINLDDVCEYVNTNIISFHEKRLQIVSDLTLRKLLSKNPYLFRAKNVTDASAFVDTTLSALLSSSEEKLFGDFLEGLAVFVAFKTTGGHKASSQGVDLEFAEGGVHYVVSIKSGPSWGNSSQQRKLGEDLQKAVNRLKQGKVHAEAVLGICYGKTRTSRHKKYGYLKLVGQNFWAFISGKQELYKEIIEPVGYRAKEHNDDYSQSLAATKNRLTGDFIKAYCDPSGVIDWNRVVQANSGNYDLDKLHLQP